MRPAYAVRVREWPGREVVFSKLAGQTEEFLDRLRAHRSLLAGESAVMLAAAVPTLPSGPRGVLAGTWLPGRLLTLEAMGALCPGLEETFRSDWLAASPPPPGGRVPAGLGIPRLVVARLLSGNGCR